MRNVKNTRLDTPKKSTVIHVPFSLEAWKRIKEVAAEKGMPASTFVRVASLAAAEK
jgi:predicted DNA binding CopG/RHH family protein